MKLIEKLKKEHHLKGWLDPEACEACASYEAGFRKALELAGHSIMQIDKARLCEKGDCGDHDTDIPICDQIHNILEIADEEVE